jgi:hypothetical protein
MGSWSLPHVDDFGLRQVNKEASKFLAESQIGGTARTGQRARGPQSSPSIAGTLPPPAWRRHRASPPRVPCVRSASLPERARPVSPQPSAPACVESGPPPSRPGKPPGRAAYSRAGPTFEFRLVTKFRSSFPNSIQNSRNLPKIHINSNLIQIL